jgi:hypothetical protein
MLPLPATQAMSAPAVVDSGLTADAQLRPPALAIDAGATGGAKKPVRPLPLPGKRPPLKPRKSCDPPYTLDKDGVRIPKPECL